MQLKISRMAVRPGSNYDEPLEKKRTAVAWPRGLLIRTETMSLTDFVEPLGARILIRKDDARQTTKGGIVLPDQAEIPTITGRVVEISAQIAHDQDFPIRKYDKVLFHPKNAIPVDLESDNVLFVVDIDDVVAVFRRATDSLVNEESVDLSEDTDGDDLDV
jgi:chaperonin GroES